MNMINNPMRNKGLTFIELMITLAIAAILFATAAPSLRSSIQENRMVTQINELQASLSLARSEAIKRNASVTVCPRRDDGNCHGSWKNGWIVFVDDNANGSIDGAEILRVHGAISSDNILTFSQSYVSYANTGLAEVGFSETFKLCDARGAENAKGLIIGRSGRPRLAIDSDLNGVREDGDQVDLVCS